MNIPIRTAARRQLRWYSILGWSLLGLLCATFFVYTLTVSLGAVHGIEFSPQTFERRSYSFFEIPFVRQQVTGVRRENLNNIVDTTLKTKNWLVHPPGKVEWHLVQGIHGPQPPRKGDAAILLQYLDATDSEDRHRWIKWSEDHDDLAKVFWPAVQKFALYELYVFVPDLFEIAKNSSDPKSLKSQLDEVSAQRLLFLARRLAAGPSPDLALKAIEEAAALQADNQEITALRDQLRAQAKPAGKKP